MKLSFQELNDILREALQSKYPAVQQSTDYPLEGWERRCYIVNTWESQVFVRFGYYREQTDPNYALIPFTVNEDAKTVELKEHVAMKLVAKPIDGGSEVEIDMEAAALNAEADETLALEVGKKYSKKTRTSLNKVMHSMVQLFHQEDLDADTLAAIKSLVKTKKATAATESAEPAEEDALESAEVFEHTESVESSVKGKFNIKDRIIEGNKVLGIDSLNQRRYPIAVQERDSAKIFEGAKAYLNHPKVRDMAEARDIRDLIGYHKNIRVEKDGTYSDLHLIDSETVRNHVMPFAEAPHLIGSSVVVRVKMKKGEDGIPEATELMACRSVDLVSEPGTTKGLFESAPVTAEPRGPDGETKETTSMELKDLTLEMLRKDRADLVTALLADSEKEKEVDTLKTEKEALTSQLKDRDEKIVSLEAAIATRDRTEEIDRLVREAKVPEGLKYEEKDGKKVIKAHVLGVLTRCENAEQRQEFIAHWEGLAASVPQGEKPGTTKQADPTGSAALDPKAAVSEAAVLALAKAV